MSKEIDSNDQPEQLEDTEGHLSPRAKRPRAREDKPADTEGNRARLREDKPADTEGHRSAR